MQRPFGLLHQYPTQCTTNQGRAWTLNTLHQRAPLPVWARQRGLTPYLHAPPPPDVVESWLLCFPRGCIYCALSDILHCSQVTHAFHCACTRARQPVPLQGRMGAHCADSNSGQQQVTPTSGYAVALHQSANLARARTGGPQRVIQSRGSRVRLVCHQALSALHTKARGGTLLFRLLHEHASAAACGII